MKLKESLLKEVDMKIERLEAIEQPTLFLYDYLDDSLKRLCGEKEQPDVPSTSAANHKINNRFSIFSI